MKPTESEVLKELSIIHRFVRQVARCLACETCKGKGYVEPPLHPYTEICICRINLQNLIKFDNVNNSY